MVCLHAILMFRKDLFIYRLAQGSVYNALFDTFDNVNQYW